MDPYQHIVQLYDLEHDALEDDTTFYLNLITEGPVLEVGCGTGRIVERLARAGLDTYGIDPSEAMLAVARKRLAGLERAHLFHMSVEQLKLPYIFQSAILPLNVLWHLADLETQVQSLRLVRQHMLEGGMLVVDVSNPHTMADRQAANEVRLRFRSDSGTEQVYGFSAAEDAEADQTLHVSLWYDVIGSDGTIRRTGTEISLRYTYRFELELALHAAGFRVVQTYGSYDLEPYSTDSTNVLMVGIAR
jgi:SAM-dependent methyltransferase